MASNSSAKAFASLRGSLATEMSLAIGVLALVAFVGMASPMG
jgi:phosphate/sulfate permease